MRPLRLLQAALIVRDRTIWFKVTLVSAVGSLKAADHWCEPHRQRWRYSRPWDCSVDAILLLLKTPACLSWWVMEKTWRLWCAWLYNQATSKQWSCKLLWPHFVAVIQVSNISFSCTSWVSTSRPKMAPHIFFMISWSTPYISYFVIRFPWAGISYKCNKAKKHASTYHLLMSARVHVDTSGLVQIKIMTVQSCTNADVWTHLNTTNVV